MNKKTIYFLLAFVAFSFFTSFGQDVNLANKYGTLIEAEGVNASYPFQKLLDGTKSTSSSGYVRTNSTSASLTIDLHNVYELSNYEISRGSSSGTNYHLQNYKVYVGNQLDALEEVADISGLTGSADRTGDFPEGTSARYVRFELSGGASHMRLSEIFINGADKVNPQLISTEATIHSRTGAAAGNEEAEFMLTGDLAAKWCDNSWNKPYWAILDFGSETDFESFKIFDARTREGGGDIHNLGSFDIYVGYSVDGENNLLDENGEPVEHAFSSGEIENPNDMANDVKSGVFPEGTKGRYVKLMPVNSDNGTIRIYEFQLFGPSPAIILSSINDKHLVNGTATVQASYALNGDKSDFSFVVSSSNDLIQAVNIIENSEFEDGKTDGTITFDLTGPANDFAASLITLTVVNGENELSRSFNAKVKLTEAPSMDDYVNVAKGKKAGSWNYPNNNNWAWNEDSMGSLTDDNDETAYNIPRTMMDVIVDLADQYLVEGAQLIFQHDKESGGFEINSSPFINIPPNDADYEPGFDPLYVKHDNIAGNIELTSGFVSFSANTITGTIKANLKDPVWETPQSMDVYELRAFVRKPVLTNPGNQNANEHGTKVVDVEFDLKGFNLISDKENKIEVTVASAGENAAKVSVSELNVDYNENKITFKLQASNPVNEVPVEVNMTNGEFDVSSQFNFTAGPITGVAQTNAEFSVFPTLVARSGEISIKSSSDSGVVQVINLQGSTVIQQAYSSKLVNINTTTLTPGMYLIKNSNSNQMVKVVVQ